MTPVRAALKEAIDVLEGMNDDEINLELLPRLKESLSAAPGEPCAVKPLEWTGRNADGSIHIAYDGPVQYWAWELAGYGYWSWGALAGREVHGGLDAAKAAAQADYEQRIRSALVTTPQPAAGWDEHSRAFDTRGSTLTRVGRVLTITCETDETANRIADELRRETPAPAEVALTADCAQLLPGGKLDDSTYSNVEDALDKIDAPCRSGDGKWLSLHERIAALASRTDDGGGVRDQIAALAHRFWSIHPSVIAAKNLTREEFYTREMTALFAALSKPTDASNASAEARLQIKTLLDETGSRDLEDLKDMAMVGHATMAAIAVVIESDGPFKDWSPAQCPSEIITDMFNMLIDDATAEARLREAFENVLSRVFVFRDHEPEEDETWESWYYAAFDLLAAEIETMQGKALSPPSGGDEAKESEGEAGSPVQSLGDNPDPAPSCFEQGLATPDTTGTAKVTTQGEVAHVGNVAKPEVGPDSAPRADHLSRPSDPTADRREIVARECADEIALIVEAAERVAKRTGNTFVLDRQLIAKMIAGRFAALDGGR